MNSCIRLLLLLTAGLCCLRCADQVQAQTPAAGPPHAGVSHTNQPPLTRLEELELLTGRVLIKGTEDIGTVNGRNGTITLKCEELQDVVSNQRVLGLVLQVRQSATPGAAGAEEGREELTTVDADEVDPLVQAVNYISRADPSVSPLTHFEASYSTRGALTVASYSSRRRSDVEAAVTIQRATRCRVGLTLAQFAEFKQLLERGQAKLEELRKPR